MRRTLVLAFLALVVACQAAGEARAASEGGQLARPNKSSGVVLGTNWVWTGDTRGGGSQAALTISGDTLTIAPVDFVFFTNIGPICGNGTYSFQFKGSQFAFAWKISPGDPGAGKCLDTGLSPVFPSALALGHGDWWGFYYGWHNGSFFWNTAPVTYDAVTWHQVVIQDYGSSLTIYLDGLPVDLFQSGYPLSSFEQDLQDGYIGIGSQAGAGVQFRGMGFNAGETPALPTTWGRIKATFRN